jgi:hypothetical protein
LAETAIGAHLKKNLPNRIRRMEDVAPDQLLANPMNWRTHPKSQEDALEGVLEQVGWVQNVIVNETTGHVIDGHLRVQLALRRNETAIPVLFVELTEEEEKRILATFDPLGAMAGADAVQLQALLKEVGATQSEAVDSLLNSLNKNVDTLLLEQRLTNLRTPQVETARDVVGEAAKRGKWWVWAPCESEEQQEQIIALFGIKPGNRELDIDRMLTLAEKVPAEDLVGTADESEESTGGQ